MRGRALALFAGILVLGALPGPALAAGMVDQHNENLDAGWTDTHIAQTVTAGLTGKLTGVDLWLLVAPAVGAKETVSIYSLARATGLPTGSPRASATVMVHEGWYHFEFLTPVPIIAGGRFAIVLTQAEWGVAYGSIGGYAGGKALTWKSAWVDLDANTDLDFRSYVDTAPATAVPTLAPKPTAALAKTPIPTATPEPIVTATLATTAPSPSAATTELTASPSPSATAAPASQPDPPAGGSGDSGGPPILLLILGIGVLAATLSGGVWLGFVLARRPRRVS